MARIAPKMNFRRAVVPLAALMAVLATLLVASPAGAATFCGIAEDGQAVLNLDESQNGSVVVTMVDEVIFANGVECGAITADFPALTIVDEGDDKVDHVIFDLSQPFRVGNKAIFVQLFLEDAGVDDARDIVTIRGTNTTDIVTLGEFLSVGKGSNYSGSENDLRLQLSLRDQNIKLNINLRGGDDLFTMSSTNRWTRPVKVKGGGGNDVLHGGAKRQRIFGGPGNDRISGGGGNDRLVGNAGRDRLDGGRGRDELRGGPGRDVANGNSGADRFFMDDGKVDTVRGQKGADTCVCDSNDDTTSVRIRS